MYIRFSEAKLSYCEYTPYSLAFHQNAVNKCFSRWERFKACLGFSYDYNAKVAIHIASVTLRAMQPLEWATDLVVTMPQAYRKNYGKIAFGMYSQIGHSVTGTMGITVHCKWTKCKSFFFEALGKQFGKHVFFKPNSDKVHVIKQQDCHYNREANQASKDKWKGVSL